MDMGRFASFCSEGKSFKPQLQSIGWAELKKQIQARDAVKKESD